MTTTESTKKSLWKRPGLWLLLAVPLVLGTGLYGLRAQAAGGGWGFGPPGMGGTPEQHKEFAQRRLDHMLDLVNATDSQRSAIKAIFERMSSEMQPIRQEHKRLHDAMLTAFAAPTVDPNQVEQLRTQVAALADRGSKVVSKALLDAAQVLTPDQRQTLVQHMRQRHGRRHFGF